MALTEALHRTGPAIAVLLTALAILLGARRSFGRDLGLLLLTVGAAQTWALWASTLGAQGRAATAFAIIRQTTVVTWVFVPAFARSFEPVDTLEAHFARTVLSDAATILAAVSFAVLLDLTVVLGFVATLLSAILGQRAPALRVRTGLALVGGALLSVWLGLDVALQMSAVAPAAALADVVQRAAVSTVVLVVGVIILARSEPRL